jgi:hypothetical protein
MAFLACCAMLSVAAGVVSCASAAPAGGGHSRQIRDVSEFPQCFVNQKKEY